MTDADLQSAILALIARLAQGGRDPAARDALLLASLRRQRHTVPPFARLCRHRGLGDDAPLSAFPALPTDVFRYAQVAPITRATPALRHIGGAPAHSRARVTPPGRLFRTSGTTHGARGVHRVPDLSLYDGAARAAASYALFADRTPMRILVVAPTSAQAPDSSLSYMLSRFIEWFGDGDSGSVWRQGAPGVGTAEGGVDVGALDAALTAACRAGIPVALLGTSFGLVHAEDGLEAANRRPFSLPSGSFIMQTGGFKGRSRTLNEQDMLDMLQARYGVPTPRIVQEYGMTELCSQMYQLGVRRPEAGRRFWVPGWMRVTTVDETSLSPLPEGALGLLRIDDLANLGSVSAIQTSDLARAGEGYVELHGRAPGAVPRGCSLAIEESLESYSAMENAGTGPGDE